MTAELAVALPAVVLVLAALVVVALTGVTQIRVADAARAGARLAVVGEDLDRVREVVAQAAGPTATVGLQEDGTWVTVTVGSSVTGSWFSGPFEVSASTTGMLESAVGQQ